MKRVLSLLLAAAMLGCSSSKAPPVADHAGHENHSKSARLMVQTDPPAPVAGRPIVLKMMIHEADGAMAREFETVHEKLVHLIIVRDGLDEFAHVHPEVDDQGNLTITHTFAKAGKYRLFADHKANGKAPAVAKAEIDVSGEPSPPPALTVNAPGQVTADGVVAQVELQNAKAGQSSEIRLWLTNESGQVIDDIEPTSVRLTPCHFSRHRRNLFSANLERPLIAEHSKVSSCDRIAAAERYLSVHRENTRPLLADGG